ncbi:MAG TPA: PAS domain S-box protein [Polyangiaceae bacterium]|nr:PAS domain S-box protein [Polyangiaceae bacterium]
MRDHPEQVVGGGHAELESARRPAPAAMHGLETEMLENLVDSITDYAVFALDPAGRVESWNEGARRASGYVAEEIIGRPVSVLYTEEDRAARRPDRILESVRKEGRFEEENWRVRKDGTRFWANVVITPRRDSTGGIAGFANVMRDLTARRQAEDDERKLERERAAREGVEVAERELERANRALGALTELAFALSNARTPPEVAAAIVEQGMRLARADTCFLYVLDDKGTALDLLAHRGAAPEIIERACRVTAPATIAEVHAGLTTWAETAAECDRINPGLARMKVTGRRARAFWSVPLIAGGGPVGLLAMGYYDERRFPVDERALVATLTKQCAHALLRAVRAEREERARAWLSTTLRSIGDAVIATDLGGRVTMMNVVAEQLTGWSETDAGGRPLDEVFSIFSAQTRERCDNPVEKVLQDGKIVGLAVHRILRSRSGVETPIADRAAPIRDAKGTVFGVVLVFRDVTAEKRSHAQRDFLARAGAVLASSLDYRATLASVAEIAVPQLADWCAVRLVDPETGYVQRYVLTHADPEKARWGRELMQGYPLESNAPASAVQVIRTGKSELHAELTPTALERIARDAKHLGLLRELNLESRMVVALRGRDRVLGALTFIYAGSGRRYTQDDLVFAEDFARRAAMAIENALAVKQAEEARAKERLLRDEADVANKAKDEFLATVSHELRTPLNAILGWTSVLRQRNHPSDLDGPLAVIERNGRRQARLIDDILDISRIISGKLSLEVAPMRLSDAIESAVECVTPAAEAKQIHIRTDLDGSLTIKADGDRLQQVVWNLLSNAVKFTPRGGHVSVRTFREGPELCICVADTGEGMAPDVLPFVFEPFRQADSSTTRKHGGLGLGLAIVRQIVAAHGGTIRAESAGAGRGSQFIVALPAGGEGAGVIDQTSPAPAGSDVGDDVVPSLQGLSVLVVDDEQDAVDLIAHALRERDARVTTAASGLEALEMVPIIKPDVIVSDVGMRGMDGCTFIRKLRSLSHDQGARTPAIALTAYAGREDARRAFAAGFQMHVSKPVEPVQVTKMVANLAGLSLSGFASKTG